MEYDKLKNYGGMRHMEKLNIHKMKEIRALMDKNNYSTDHFLGRK
ncbi:MAG: hypothetical protein ACP5JU_03765 [Minisyncoccia bacterium]